jgi:hypothetical protein
MTLFLAGLLPATSVLAVENADEKRLDEVAKRGSVVMPFDLGKTTHLFTKTEKGGLQQVVVKKSPDAGQVQLIRKHLSKIAAQFRLGDFSGPAKIHGDDMPGLTVLRTAKPGQINIAYKELPNGAEIDFSTDIPSLVEAIHAWFDAQLSDHARHAMPVQSHHSMHQMP